jgi:hypothetical protein
MYPLRYPLGARFQINDVVAKRVERELGVADKNWWRMCHQIRPYMGSLHSYDSWAVPVRLLKSTKLNDWMPHSFAR